MQEEDGEVKNNSKTKWQNDDNELEKRRKDDKEQKTGDGERKGRRKGDEGERR
jgi:hypothetical protein